jgi:hypothetical protein
MAGSIPAHYIDVYSLLIVYLRKVKIPHLSGPAVLCMIWKTSKIGLSQDETLVVAPRRMLKHRGSEYKYPHPLRELHSSRGYFFTLL